MTGIRASVRAGMLAWALVVLSACDGVPNGTGQEMQRLYQELAHLAPPSRSFAGRVSLPTVHVPCVDSLPIGAIVPLGTCPHHREVPSHAIVALASRASSAVRRDGTVDALHAAALVDLLWPDQSGKSLDRSVSFLHAAVLMENGRAVLHNDLAAAYLRRAEVRQEPRDLLAALEYASRALSFNSHYAPAAFNRALALERMGLYAEAAEAFVHAGLVDDNVAWRSEGRMRARSDSAIARDGPAVELRVSTSPEALRTVARIAPHHARAFGWDTVLVRWGEASMRGAIAQAREQLEIATRLGGALREEGRDSSLLVATLAIGRTAPGSRLLLARAHAAFGRGRRAYENAEYPTAIAAFDAARRDASASPALRLASVLWKGISLAQSGPPEPAEPLFATVVKEAERRGFVALVARGRSARATSLMRTGRAEEALRELRESAHLHAAIGETDNVGLAQSLQAVALTTLGDRAGSLAAGLRAIHSLRGSRGSVRLHNALYLLAEQALKDSLLLCALAVQGEGVRVADVSRDPLTIAEARVALGRIHRARRDSTAMTLAFRAARLALASASDGIGKAWVLADLELADGEGSGTWERGRSASLAEPNLKADSAIAFFRSVALPLRYLPALRARATRDRARGDVKRARADLTTILSTVARDERETRDHAQRAGLLASARDASEELVLMNLAEGDVTGALDALERGRASSRDGRVRPRGVRARAPQRAPVVDLAVVHDTLLAWVITHDSVALVRTPLTGTAWRERIARIRGLLELRVDGAAVAADLGAMYDLVIRPLERLLPPQATMLTIVADGELADAPLAALLDSRSRRYVAERWALRYAASLDDALRVPLGGARETPPARQRAVLVADPAIDASRFPELVALPQARGEVRDVAAHYARATVLEGSEATLESLRRLVVGAAMVHVAAHARFAPAAPERSEVVLAGENAVSATELARLPLGGTRLVVLSACEAAREGGGRGAGLLGLVSALRRAGARSVLGGLWRIGDEEGRAMMAAFHARYATSGDAAQALRVAQLAMLEGGDARLRSPAVWAGWRVVGW